MPALREYAAQQDCDPFAVCLWLNYPMDADASDSFDAVKAARTEFPDLDLRISGMSYQEPTIGQIRKDLWDSVLTLAYHEGNFASDKPSEDIIGINHDIDTVRIDQHYIRNIQRYYERAAASRLRQLGIDASLPVRHTQVRHEYPAKRYPNIAKGVLLQDYSTYSAYPNGAFEAGTVIPMLRYVERGGFDPEALDYETSFAGDIIVGIPHTRLITSARRYVDRLDEQGFENIWSTGSFGANDRCRTTVDRADISPGRLEDLLFDALDYHADTYIIPSLNKYYNDNLMNEVVITGGLSDTSMQAARVAVQSLVQTSIQRMARAASMVMPTDSVYPTVVAESVPEAYDRTLESWAKLGLDIRV